MALVNEGYLQFYYGHCEHFRPHHCATGPYLSPMAQENITNGPK